MESLVSPLVAQVAAPVVKSVVMWFYLALVQMHGGVGEAFGTQQECQAAQAKLAARAETVAISPCTAITLEFNGDPK